jgi:hypothetical protein
MVTSRSIVTGFKKMGNSQEKVENLLPLCLVSVRIYE